MDISQQLGLAKSRKSVFNRLAWASIIIPASAFCAMSVIFKVDWHISWHVQQSFLFGSFYGQVVSLIFGIVSLFGIPRYGAKLILWKAAVGILASIGMGFLSAVGLIMNGMGHNC